MVANPKYLAAVAVFSSSLLFSQLSNYAVLNSLTEGDLDTGLFVATARGWRPGLLALVLFTFVDLGMYGFRHKTVGDFVAFRSEIDAPSEPPEWKLEPDYLPTYNIMGPLMKGYSTPAGRASLEPHRRLDYYLNETPLRGAA